MYNEISLPSLKGWEPTRDTLHWYSKAVGVIPRAHASFHPKWWHISLKVVPDGLITDEMPLPESGSFSIKMNLKNHTVAIITNQDQFKQFSMTKGLSSTEFGNQLLTAVADLGLTDDYDRTKFENDEARYYKEGDAVKYFSALKFADLILKEHRGNIGGEVGPVQLWPHNFDLAFEWFGTLVIDSGPGAKKIETGSQLNLGFAPGDDSHPEPYFYSNPWPFEKEFLLNKNLPAGARWFTESWQGTLLPYNELVGDICARERLLEYANTVYQFSLPTLQEPELRTS